MIKPYYESGGITIYHGDCRGVFAAICSPAYRVITDPPYGFGAYDTDSRIGVSDVLRLASSSCTLAAFGFPELLVEWCIELRRAPSEWVTWWPTNKALARTSADRLPREHEAIAIFGEVFNARELLRPRADEGCKIKEKVGTNLPPGFARVGDVWRDPAPGIGFNSHLRLHPNEKPLSLMAKLITLCSRDGDVVLDPFCGSGTTLVAAKHLGRRAIGIELEEKYCEVAVQRLAQDVLFSGA